MDPRRKPRLLLTSVFLLGAVAAAVWISRTAEPRHQGRSLGFWVEQYARGKPNPQSDALMWVVGALPLHSSQGAAPKAEEAIRAIGPKAWPSLVKWLSYEKSSARARLESMGLDIHARFGLGRYIPSSIFWDRKQLRKVYAYEVFVMLGPDASSAVPLLAQALPHCRYPSTMRDLILLGRTTGPAGTVALSDFLAHPRSDAAPERVTEARCQIIYCLSSSGTNHSYVLEVLAGCVSDPDPRVAFTAAKVLARLSLHSELVVPVLIQALDSLDPEVRRTAAEHLACYFENASQAVPRLSALLKDRDPVVRVAAETALQCIAPEHFSKHGENKENTSRGAG